MTSTENNENPNYETLYKSLKEEYEQSKEDNDELCKEYESTIQLLTESVQKFEKEKKDFQNKISKYENDVKNISKEKENLIKKNKDKLIDIQCLNEQNEKLNNLIKKYKEEKSVFDNRIVTLENDVDHYQNKIREYEDFIEELKSQLENALEENITLQNEYETYKLNMGEQMLRKEEEIKDIINDNKYKDKVIKKLSQNSQEKIDIKNLQQKLINDKKIIPVKRRFSVLENNFNKINIPNFQILDTNSYNNNRKINGRINLKENSFYSGMNTPKDSDVNKYFKCNTLINTEKKIEQRKNEMNGLNTVATKQNNDNKNNNINKKFEQLIICEENNIFIINNNKYNYDDIYNNYNNRKNEFEKELKNMMINIQKRKNTLLNLKRQINEKMAKLEFRKN
jgi:regulator of replication initiation timing